MRDSGNLQIRNGRAQIDEGVPVADLLGEEYVRIDLFQLLLHGFGVVLGLGV